MEAPEYIHGGYYRAGTPQYVMEKKGLAGNGDHFIVEDLLDLSNGEGEEEEPAELKAAGDDVAPGNFSADSSTVTAIDSCCNSSLSGCAPGRSLAGACLSGDLCEPYEELAELEWLSNFVEESFSSEDLQKLHLISGIKSTAIAGAGVDADTKTVQPRAPSPSSSSATTATPAGLFRPEGPVPAKARSKRSRAAATRSWSSHLLAISPTPSKPKQDLSPIKTEPLKKKDTSSPANFAPSQGRRCLHCETDKTPQWRTGPLGPKTLCNACGVRFKSGRLVPEYRPAASPTFVVSKHSNSHRKVLELRRQKELNLQQLQNQQLMLHGAQANGDDFLIHHRIGPDFRQLI